jgi:hypothetical protein
MKLKAITIIDIVVTLAISTFIVMIAMLVYLIVTAQFADYKRLNDELKDVYHLTFVLNKDFLESPTVNYNSENNTIILDSINPHKYIFGEEDIVRIMNQAIDTFRIKCVKIECNFNREIINTGMLDECAFEFSLMKYNERLSFYLSKCYAADVLIEQRNLDNLRPVTNN